MPQASFGYFGLAQETTPGTGVAPTRFLPVHEVDFPTEKNYIDKREIRGSRQAYKSFAGATVPSATIKTAFYGGGAMGVLLKALIGAETAAAVAGSATAFKHTYADSLALPSLTLERADAKNGVAGAVLIERLAGCKVEQFSMNCQFGEEVECDFTLQALKAPDTTVSRVASPTFPTYNPFIFTGASVTVDTVSSSLFKSVKADFKNTLTRQDTLRGSTETYRIYEGGLECTLTGMMAFEDLTMYDKFKNATSLAVVLTLQGDLIDATPTPDAFYEAKFSWPKLFISKFSVPFVAGDVVEADVEFKVVYDDTAARAVLLELTTSDNTTSYNAP